MSQVAKAKRPMQFEVEGGMEGFICSPSSFVRQHWQRLLPHWSVAVLSMLILLQRSPTPLDDYTAEAELSKQRLRDRAIQLLQPLIVHIRQSSYDAVMFDPQTGFPYQSPMQGMPLNDVAVIYDVLGYSLKRCGECYCLVHPRWGSQVYPTIVMCSAPMSASNAIASYYFSTRPQWVLEQSQSGLSLVSTKISTKANVD